MDAEETRKKYPSLPANYVSLLKLQQIRLRQQQQQKQKEEQGEEKEEVGKKCPQSRQAKLPLKNRKKCSQQTKSEDQPPKNHLQIQVPGQEEETQRLKETDGKQLPQQQNVDKSSGEKESKEKKKHRESKKKKKPKQKLSETLARESTELDSQEIKNPKIPPSTTAGRKESLPRYRRKGKSPLPRYPVPEINRIVQKIHDLRVYGDKMLGKDYWRASGRSRGTLMWVPKEENSVVNSAGSR